MNISDILAAIAVRDSGTTYYPGQPIRWDSALSARIRTLQTTIETALTHLGNRDTRAAVELLSGVVRVIPQRRSDGWDRECVTCGCKWVKQAGGDCPQCAMKDKPPMQQYAVSGVDAGMLATTPVLAHIEPLDEFAAGQTWVPTLPGSGSRTIIVIRDGNVVYRSPSGNSYYVPMARWTDWVEMFGCATPLNTPTPGLRMGLNGADGVSGMRDAVGADGAAEGLE